jgi:SSS family transporter
MDYVLVGILIVYLAVVAYVGIWGMRKSKTLTDYIIAGRKIPPLVLAFTLLATWFSGWAFVGNPGYMYAFGFPAMHWNLFLGIGIMLSIAFFALPLRTSTERLGSLSIPDWIGDRYDSKIARGLTAILVIIILVISMVAQYKAIALLFEPFLGLTFQQTTVIFGLIVVFYACIGGLFAVVYTDFLQGALMLPIALAPILAFSMIGGTSGFMDSISGVVEPYYTGFTGGLNTPMYLLAIGLCFLVLHVSSVYNSVRFLFLKKEKGSFLKLLWLVLGLYCILWVAGFTGWFGKAVYPDLASPDSIMPLMITTVFPRAAALLLTLTILAAVMSSSDSILMTMGTAFGRDLYQKCINPSAEDRKVLLYTRIAVIVLGIIPIIMLLWRTPQFLAIFMAMGTTGLATAILAPIILGVYWKRGTKLGTIASIIAGPTVYVFGIKIMGWAWPYAGVLAFFLAGLLYIVISLVTPPPSDEIIRLGYTGGGVEETGSAAKGPKPKTAVSHVEWRDVYIHLFEETPIPTYS